MCDGDDISSSDLYKKVVKMKQIFQIVRCWYSNQEIYT